ncbi:baseplate J/gp47 family protein [Candidatus Uabimicrobium sp. HlEnr_7]|uniref:baseplate J/gp47 family protein n=1 Tax=Candidatus Uabimicrobium helgolandensis TaxID=3095367 RepID=UPI0035574470
MKPPLLDNRNSVLIYRQAVALAKKYCPQWADSDWDKDHFDEDDPGLVILKLYANLLDVVRHRLNQMPYKYQLAFYDFLAIDILPAKPATVPLTFSVVKNNQKSLTITVPKFTQVAAKNNPAVVFETMEELVASDMKLSAGYFVDSHTGKYGDFSYFFDDNQDEVSEEDYGHVFATPQQIPHSLTLDFREFLPVNAGKISEFEITIQGRGLEEKYFNTPQHVKSECYTSFKNVIHFDKKFLITERTNYLYLYHFSDRKWKKQAVFSPQTKVKSMVSNRDVAVIDTEEEIIIFDKNQSPQTQNLPLEKPNAQELKPSIAISQNIVVVGVPEQKKVYIHQVADNTIFKFPVIEITVNEENFGKNISIDDDILVIVSDVATHVYSKNEKHWGKIARYKHISTPKDVLIKNNRIVVWGKNNQDQDVSYIYSKDEGGLWKKHNIKFSLSVKKENEKLKFIDRIEDTSVVVEKSNILKKDGHSVAVKNGWNIAIKTDSRGLCAFLPELREENDKENKVKTISTGIDAHIHDFAIDENGNIFYTIKRETSHYEHLVFRISKEQNSWSASPVALHNAPSKVEKESRIIAISEDTSAVAIATHDHLYTYTKNTTWEQREKFSVSVKNMMMSSNGSYILLETESNELKIISNSKIRDLEGKIDFSSAVITKEGTISVVSEEKIKTLFSQNKLEEGNIRDLRTIRIATGDKLSMVIDGENIVKIFHDGAQKLSLFEDFIHVLQQNSLHSYRQQNGTWSKWLKHPLIINLSQSTRSSFEKIARDSNQLTLIPEQGIINKEFDQQNVKVESVFANIAMQNITDKNIIVNDFSVSETKGFYAFGEFAKKGNTLYIGSQAFSQDQISINFELREQREQQLPEKFSLPKVSCYYWEENNWEELRENNINVEGTINFLQKDNVTVAIKRPSNMNPTEIDGQKNYWIKFEVTQGKYFTQPTVEKNKTEKYSYDPGENLSPYVKKITINCVHKASVWLQTHNFFDTTPWAKKITPYKPVKQERSLYLGFTGASEDETISLFFNHHLQKQEIKVDAIPNLRWFYPQKKQDNLFEWQEIPSVKQDEIELFTSGSISKIPILKDIKKCSLFNKSSMYWLRGELHWSPEQLKQLDTNLKENAPEFFKKLLRLQGIHPNTTLAQNAITIQDEIIGSGTGETNAVVSLSQSPVLQNEWLEIQESNIPSQEELIELIKWERKEYFLQGLEIESLSQQQLLDMLTISGKKIIRKQQEEDEDKIWIKWFRVETFAQSTQMSRHYTLHYPTGVITFGNGSQGMVVPKGKNNIVMRNYRSGGGANGNVLPHQITDLKTTIPHITQVTNTVRAYGGNDEENVNSFIERVPYRIKNRDRAVTVDDFEQLTYNASQDVARVKCIVEPITDNVLNNINIVVLPKYQEQQPKPNAELKRIIESYLRKRALLSLQSAIRVVNPDYVNIDFKVKITLKDATNMQIRKKIENLIRSFMHPVFGRDGKGWEFGKYTSQGNKLLIENKSISLLLNTSIIAIVMQISNVKDCEITIINIDGQDSLKALPFLRTITLEFK